MYSFDKDCTVLHHDTLGHGIAMPGMIHDQTQIISISFRNLLQSIFSFVRHKVIKGSYQMYSPSKYTMWNPRRSVGRFAGNRSNV